MCYGTSGVSAFEQTYIRITFLYAHDWWRVQRRFLRLWRTHTYYILPLSTAHGNEHHKVILQEHNYCYFNWQNNDLTFYRLSTSFLFDKMNVIFDCTFMFANDLVPFSYSSLPNNAFFFNFSSISGPHTSMSVPR
jgi:hypothetical protein